MMYLRFRFTFLIAALLAFPSAGDEALRAAADRARDKIDAIVVTAEETRDTRAAPVRTMLTEVEINAYLEVHAPEFLPPGIAGPRIRIGDESRLWARAIVDLGAVRKARPRGWRDPLAYVAGSVEVVASGRITADDGLGRAELESATVAGLAVPKSVVQELVRFYTATPERPEGFDLDQPFELPARIDRVLIERSRATVVQ